MGLCICMEGTKGGLDCEGGCLCVCVYVENPEWKLAGGGNMCVWSSEREWEDETRKE